MKRIIPLIAVIMLIFTGCNKEEVPPYNLAVCDINNTQLCEYLDVFEGENYRLEKMDFTAEQLSGLVASLNEDSEGLSSMTFYGEGIDDALALTLINFAAQKNIPVIFAFSNISTEVLLSYDKAFCITTDYIHAGEITAVKIKQLWSDGAIADSNEDQIFSFSIIKEETEEAWLEDYYNTLIAGIELYGIPMQINSTVSPAEIPDTEALAALKAENEGIVVINPALLPVVSQYTSETENVEIITIQQGVENSFAGSANTVNCFVDYKSYKLAVDEILQNYNNRQYPLIESSFFVKDRTVFIPATI